MTSEEIVEKFAHALDNFEPITVQPSDTDLTRLQEAAAPLLLKIPYDLCFPKLTTLAPPYPQDNGPGIFADAG